jgi:hydroxymethylpyrimidine/phosphomethylpyrimidine kinase
MSELRADPNSTSDLDANPEDAQDAAPGLVMCFNVADPTGAGGNACDVTAVASVGSHALPVVTGVLIRDSAEVFDQARALLEDGEIHAFKVGNCDNVESVSAIAELIADYPDVPVVTYVGNLSHVDESQIDDYLSAIGELIVPQTYVLCGNFSLLQALLLPEWDASEPPTPWQIAKAAAEAGGEYVLITGVPSGSGTDGFLENVLISDEQLLLRERFERFDVSFVGAGDTLSAVLAGLLASGMPIEQAAVEALQFLDQSLESGFRPGMGMVLPDRLFWAHPGDDAADEEDDTPDIGLDLPPPRTH